MRFKSEFHKLIDNPDNEKVLNNFYEEIIEYSKRDNSIDIIDELTDEQKIRLKDSLKQVKVGKTMSHEKAKDEIRKWYLNF